MANYSLSSPTSSAAILAGTNTLSAALTGSFGASTANRNYSLTGITRNTYHKPKRPFSGQLIPRHGQAGRDI